ncbi:MAG: MBL fold metallo-hydrolase [Prevotellaceae bacterium]|jgi:L-ascorbate metabolism protein UlaG (beta-lactamase superfamily)|nr:MBL fold metallo-hydrolase [Prevotellaceae bacterium]
MKQRMISSIVILFLLVAGVIAYTHLPHFGSLPKGERLNRVHRSSGYRDGRFQNMHPAPQLTASFRKAFFQSSSEHRRPEHKIPAIKTDFAALNPQENLLIWFGHSSYYMQINGTRFLIDPVFSHAASPVPFFNTAFAGTDLYRAEDMPAIDCLIITHDHWDHLDYSTVKALKSRIGKVICPLGVGEHLERWHFNTSDIIEMDWGEQTTPFAGFEMYCLPARHFSGRGFKSGQSLWASFLLKSEQLTVFIGGDSGYDTHFATIGKRFGAIDLALLENGQYNEAWKYIHMQPHETLQAAEDLYAKKLIPIHNSKFSLSRHSWDEPLQRICEEYDKKGAQLQLLTPKIGEIVFLKDTVQTFDRWWQTL